MKLSQIKANPDNPRIIKDEQFDSLVKSLKDFPEMTKIRPIVVNKDHVILGGNMRYKAMIEAGWKEAPVKVVDLTEDQQKEFIIKDNISGGDWDFGDLLDWDQEKLADWGLDIALGDTADEFDDDFEADDKTKDLIIIEIATSDYHEIESDIEKILDRVKHKIRET